MTCDYSLPSFRNCHLEQYLKYLILNIWINPLTLLRVKFVLKSESLVNINFPE